MSDELAIQPQIQQPQKNNNALVAGGAIGATTGIVAGAMTAPKLLGKTMSYEDVIAEVNSKDKFEARTKEGAAEASTWKEVQTQANELAELKKQAEAAGKPTLPASAPEQQAYDAAVKAKNDAFQAIVNQEKAKLGAYRTGGDALLDPVKGYPEKDVIDLKKLMKNGKDPSFINRVWDTLGFSSVRNEYDSLRTGIINEYGKAWGEISGADQIGGKRDAARAAIESEFEAIATEYRALTGVQDKKDFFKINVIDSSHGYEQSVHSNTYNRLFNVTKTIYPDIPTLDNPMNLDQASHFRKFGAFSEKAPEKLAAGQTSRPILFIDEAGRQQYGYITYTEEAKENYVKNAAKELEAKRAAETEKLLANAQSYENLSAAHDPVELKKRVGREFTENQLKDMGHVTGGSLYDRTNWAHMDTIITEGGDEGKKYLQDIQKLDEAITRGDKTLPTGLNGDYCVKNPAFGTPGAPTGTPEFCSSATKPEEALKMAKQRYEIVSRYAGRVTEGAERIAATINSCSEIERLNGEIREHFNKHEGYAKARAKMVERFPDVPNQGVSATDSEIAAKAEEAAKKTFKPEEYDKTIAEKQKILDEAKSKSGKVDEAAKKAADEKVATAEKVLKEKAEALGKKIKTGGNRYAGAAIGALALGLAGLGIGSLFSKDEA